MLLIERSTMADTQQTTPKPGEPDAATKIPHYTVVPFPKIVFFYPLMFISIVCGIMQAFSQAKDSQNYVAGTLFIVFFLVNILVIAFDFPGVKALAFALTIIALVFGIILLDQKMEGKLLLGLGKMTRSLSEQLWASTTFYFVVSAILFIMIGGGILANVMWNRWTVEPNRLIHKYGMPVQTKTYPVIDLEIEKQVEDVFEYILLFSGTLTFNIPNNPQVRLENIPFVDRAERKIRTIVRKERHVSH